MLTIKGEVDFSQMSTTLRKLFVKLSTKGERDQKTSKSYQRSLWMPHNLYKSLCQRERTYFASAIDKLPFSKFHTSVCPKIRRKLWIF